MIASCFSLTMTASFPIGPESLPTGSQVENIYFKFGQATIPTKLSKSTVTFVHNQSTISVYCLFHKQTKNVKQTKCVE